MKITRILTMMLLVAAGGFGSAVAEAPEAFVELARPYEQIRLALLGDVTTDVEKNALAIRKRAQELLDAFDAETSGVPEAEAEAGKKVLSEIANAAGELATAVELEEAREALFGLSKPMGRYRKLTGDHSVVVAFCPMEKKAWLQPEGDIGNPYLGQEMPTCGSVIPD